MQEAPEKAPVNGVKIAHSVVVVMESLAEVMEREMALIDKKDYNAMEDIRKEKLKMVRDYQTQMTVIAENDGVLKALPQATRQTLKEVGLKLAKVSQKNELALRAAITGTQALVQTIMSAARNQSKNMDSYSDPRKSPMMLGSYSPMCNPVAVNRTA